MATEANSCVRGSLTKAAYRASFHYPADSPEISQRPAPEGGVHAEGIFSACPVLNVRILGAFHNLGGISDAALCKRPPHTPLGIVKPRPVGGEIHLFCYCESLYFWGVVVKLVWKRCAPFYLLD